MAASKKRCAGEGEPKSKPIFHGTMAYCWDEEACGYTSTDLQMFEDRAEAMKELELLAYGALWCEAKDEVPEGLDTLYDVLFHLRKTFLDDAMRECLPEEFKTRLGKEGGFTIREVWGAQAMSGHAFAWDRESGIDWYIGDLEYTILE
jgi:hypothetical protein